MGNTTHIRAAQRRRRVRQTLAAVYDRHGASVYGLAQWITGDAAVAARLTAEVFSQLRYLSVSGGIDGLGDCLRADVHRRAVAWTRANSALSRRRVALPFAGFADLDDQERVVIAEAYFGAKTYDEVAAMLHIDRTDVARLMQGALQRLGSPAEAGVNPTQTA